MYSDKVQFQNVHDTVGTNFLFDIFSRKTIVNLHSVSLKLYIFSYFVNLIQDHENIFKFSCFGSSVLLMFQVGEGDMYKATWWSLHHAMGIVER